MDEVIKKYHPLGQRTLMVLVFRRSALFFILVAMLLVLVFVLDYVPAQYLAFAIDGVLALSMGCLVTLFIAMFLGWLQYWRYWIFIDEKDVKLYRGLIMTEQIGIPYRRIQDIKIKRSLIDQIFGVADIIITVLGSEKNQNFEEESAMILPALSQQIAQEIQSVVLSRAQVEQVTMLQGTHSAP
jgi:uncharacterized membrane protein YdbT with pleckstrin-like domain